MTLYTVEHFSTLILKNLRNFTVWCPWWYVRSAKKLYIYTGTQTETIQKKSAKKCNEAYHCDSHIFKFKKPFFFAYLIEKPQHVSQEISSQRRVTEKALNIFTMCILTSPRSSRFPISVSKKFPENSFQKVSESGGQVSKWFPNFHLETNFWKNFECRNSIQSYFYWIPNLIKRIQLLIPSVTSLMSRREKISDSLSHRFRITVGTPKDNSWRKSFITNICFVTSFIVLPKIKTQENRSTYNSI